MAPNKNPHFCTILAIFYACMARGCDVIPNVSRAEKCAVLERIAQSDKVTSYRFWEALEPGNLAGRWDGPPHDPYPQPALGLDPGRAHSERVKRRV